MKRISARQANRRNLKFEALEDRRLLASVGDDAYEQNDTMATASALGTIFSSRTLSKLVMADGADWYSFDLATARSSVSVNLQFTHASGNLDLRVFNSAGREIGGSLGTTNTEAVSLKSLTAGRYFVHVFGKSGATNPNYGLSINPGTAVANTIDLQGMSLQAPNAASWGSTIDVESQIRNTGNTASGTFSTQWYLSKDATGSSGDILLTLANGTSSSAHTGIAAGRFGAKQTISLKLPTTAPTGFSGMSFYLIMKTDSANLVSEANEANNFGQMGDGIDREKMVISPRSTTFGSFDAWDASTDDNINSVMSDGALRVNYNFNLSAPKLTKMTLEAVGQSNAVTTLADFGTSSVGVQRLVNLATAPVLGSGVYQLRLKATTTSGVQYSSVDTIKVLAVTSVVDDYHGRTLTSPIVADSGLVVRGGGGTDTLSLNANFSEIVSLNGMNPVFSANTSNQAIYKGSAYDYMRLSNGAEIYFQGIERLQFADGSVKELVTRPNDPAYTSQWNLHVTDVPSAWRFTTGSSNVLLVSLDTGFSSGPQALHLGPHDFHAGQLVTDARDFSNYSQLPADYPYFVGHGHQAMSVMAAATNNGQGVAGINQVSNVFVVNVYGSSNLQQGITEAIAYARARNMKVVFQAGIQGEPWLSEPWLTNGGSLASLKNLVSANSDIALFAVAAGNGGPDGNLMDSNWQTSVSGFSKFESEYGNVMSAGALQNTQSVVINAMTNANTVNIASYSNRGSNLTLMAPTDSPAVEELNRIMSFGGTSCANPNLAAISSLVWSVNPNLTPANVRQILVDTANDLGATGDDNVFGNGLVNADAAVRRAVALNRALDLANLYPNTPLTLVVGSAPKSVARMSPPVTMPFVSNVGNVAISRAPSLASATSDSPLAISPSRVSAIDLLMSLPIVKTTASRSVRVSNETRFCIANDQANNFDSFFESLGSMESASLLAWS